MTPIIDLRSDTVTKPSPGMRAAMAAAEVGDDVYREDPTINHLEERVAAMLGKEAALFVPSGSMSNQLAVKTHTQPGDELICEEYCHIYNWEAGGPAFLSSVTCRTICAEYGIIEIEQLRDKIRPINEHMVRTRLVCLENTHNRGGGRIFPLEKVESICGWAHEHGLVTHLDGARLWNAIVATGVPARTWGEHFDSVSVCFSKGLGAPVGSALAGPKDFINRAHRYRKIFGGAMRQAGVLAAAVLYALDNNVQRLADDHRNAQVIAQAIADTPGLRLVPPDIHTNLVWFEVDPELGTAQELVKTMAAKGIMLGLGGTHVLRACTHLDVSAADAERAAETIRRTVPHTAAVG
jgi:threonine aldolase